MKLKSILETIGAVAHITTPLTGDTFAIQDTTAERTVTDKSLWGRSGVWRYRIENAGDILRELSSRGDTPDYIYIGEKVGYLEKWIARNAGNEPTPIPSSIRTLQDFDAHPTLHFTDATDSYEYLVRFHGDTLAKIQKQYENIPVYTEEQKTAKDLILALLKNDIDTVKTKLKDVVTILDRLKKDRTLTYTPLVEYVQVNPNDKRDPHDIPPLKDNQTIKVYHGLGDSRHIHNILTRGLTGKNRAPRRYSYEAFNNPRGLFVTPIFKVAKEFADEIIIEFVASMTDLESPVWADNGLTFLSQESNGFTSDEERELKRMEDRLRHATSRFKALSQSDRPELAFTLLWHMEAQALFIGDLNPNMIKAVWWRDGSTWTRYKTSDFIKKYDINTKPNYSIIYKAADRFTIDDFAKRVKRKFSFATDSIIHNMLRRIGNAARTNNFSDYEAQFTTDQPTFYPRQISDIKAIYNAGGFDSYMN
jgi:hypothetical protein